MLHLHPRGTIKLARVEIKPAHSIAVPWLLLALGLITRVEATHRGNRAHSLQETPVLLLVAWTSELSPRGTLCPTCLQTQGSVQGANPLLCLRRQCGRPWWQPKRRRSFMRSQILVPAVKVLVRG